MLFSPAVCGSCSAIFASSEVMAERYGSPASYRASAGRCPRCGGRGAIPRWIFGFHAVVVAARDQAATSASVAVWVAAREMVVADGGSDATALAAVLTGAWRGVAAALWRIPLTELDAALTMLCHMLEPLVAEYHGDDRESPGGVTASAETGIPDAGRSPMSA